MHASSSNRCGIALSTCALFFLAVGSASAADVKLPDGAVVKKVDFERQLMGVLGRTGCNSGSCHGSFQGKGGFRLSLFGYDPEKDFLAITRDSNGRRINRQDPDSSLLLLKATGQVAHGGKTRFDRQSWAYQLLREWIVQGAAWEKGSGEVKAITITPSEYAFAKPGLSGVLTVQATFADGSTENITPLCDFRTNDETIVEVNPLGEVKALRPGDTAIVVSYRGNVLPVRVLVPTVAPAGFKYPDVPTFNYIDREVFAKLKRLNVVPSDLADDGEFLRRVTLDTTGMLPTAKEVLDFETDPSADKRARKIDELLAHPLHAALWATKLSDITGNNTAALENPQLFQPKLSQMWHEWLRKRVAENRPYDEIVRGILCATSRENWSPEEYLKHCDQIEEEAKKGFATSYPERNTLDLFWRRQQAVTVDQWGEKTAAAFLGVRLECAQCHKHPFDRWTQSDYRSYANIFAAVSFGTSPASKTVFDTANADRKKAATDPKAAANLLTIREVFIGGGGKGTAPLPNPETNRPLGPKALGGPEITVKAGEDPRVALFEWMRRDDNPFFARSFVNRTWGHYFGVGIVNPVDDFSLANPPSNEKLLDALAKDFIASKFDIRRLERTILNSRTYQLSHLTNDSNRLDRKNYAHAYVRPLMAEVVVDVLAGAFAVPEDFGPDAPKDCHAIEVGSSRVQNVSVAYALRVFGRPPRTTACDCERATEPGLPQKLFLMADNTLKQKLDKPNNRVKTLLAAEKDDDKALETLFLSTLARRPQDKERAAFGEFRKSAKTREAAFNDALWAIINTTEFIFNH